MSFLCQKNVFLFFIIIILQLLLMSFMIQIYKFALLREKKEEQMR